MTDHNEVVVWFLVVLGRFCLKRISLREGSWISMITGNVRDDTIRRRSDGVTGIEKGRRKVVEGKERKVRRR